MTDSENASVEASPLFAEINQRASDWMHRGIALLETNIATQLREAVRCFDEAIALRRSLPLAENPRYRYGLAAGWINRGDALARLGDKESLDDAIDSYDQGIALSRTLPMEEDCLYPRRLAIAWINRGYARQKETSVARAAKAAACFRESMVILDDPTAVKIPDRDLLRAGARTNLAKALLDKSDESGEEARSLLLTALELNLTAERNNLAAAEIGFTIRHVLCRAIAQESRDGRTIPEHLLELATRSVDEGLELSRYWERQGEIQFRSMAEELFRFGCRIYQVGHPHSLAKYILENLDPEKAKGVPPVNAETHEAALAALWNALKEIQRGGFPSPGSRRCEEVMENLRMLRVTEERLQQLRQAA
jgi:tetratricopeptide (TPR) repeat protein